MSTSGDVQYIMVFNINQRLLSICSPMFTSIREQSLSMIDTGAEEICEKQKIISYPL